MIVDGCVVTSSELDQTILCSNVQVGPGCQIGHDGSEDAAPIKVPQGGVVVVNRRMPGLSESFAPTLGATG